MVAAVGSVVAFVTIGSFPSLSPPHDVEQARWRRFVRASIRARWAREPPSLLGRVVDREDLPDLVERQLQVAQAGDRPGGLELLPPVAAVAGEPVDVGRPEQVELVVVAQGADAQPGEPGEPSDRQQVVIHAAPS